MYKDAKIVIIDDNVGLTKTLSMLINMYEPEVKVFEAHTGQSGIELISEKEPDLIILDVKLPDLCGSEVCRLLKKKDRVCHIPIMIVTGLTDDKELKSNFLEMGADAFLKKPFDNSELIAQIRALLRLKKAEDELRRERDQLEGKVVHQSKELDEQKERWNVVAEYVIGGIWDWDLRTDNIHVSNQWKKMLGYQADEIENEPRFILNMVHPADRKRLRKAINGYLTRKDPELNSEVRLRCKDGTYRWFLYRGHALWSEEGEPIRLIGIHFDITDHKEQIISLEKMALYDSLTRLPNRVLFYDYTTKMIAAAKRTGQRIGILFMDLDNFKEINDNYGHAKGDIVLKKIAKRLESLIRPFDFIGRFGGDEFMIALFNLQSEKELNTITQRLIEGVAKPLRIDGKQQKVEFSIGASVYPDDAEQIDDLLKIADKKMYRDKKGKKKEAINPQKKGS